METIEFPELTAEDKRKWKEWLEEHIEFLGRDHYRRSRDPGPRPADAPVRMPGKRGDDVL